MQYQTGWHTHLQDCKNIWLARFWLQDLWRPCAFVLIVLFPNVTHLQQGIKISGLVSPSHGPVSNCIIVSRESSNTAHRFGILIQWLFSLLISSRLEVVSRLELNREYDLVATVGWISISYLPCLCLLEELPPTLFPTKIALLHCSMKMMLLLHKI